jgi:hypothetical protein
MKDYLIGVISWSSLLMTRRWSRVLLGTLALRHFLCSWLASPFSPTRIAETFIYMTDSAAGLGHVGRVVLGRDGTCFSVLRTFSYLRPKD